MRLEADAEFEARVARPALARARAGFGSAAGLLVSMREAAGDDAADNSRGTAARAASVLRADLPVCPARIGTVNPVGWAFAPRVRDAFATPD